MKSAGKTIGIAFALAVAGFGGAEAKPEECCKNPYNATRENINFYPLRTAGVHIPIHNERFLEGSRFQYDVRAGEINVLQFVFASTASVYTGPEKSGGTLCPYLDIPDSYIVREKPEDDVTRITLQLNPVLVEVIREYGCALTPKPRP